MSEIILPHIEHADVNLNVRNRVVVQMHDGWGFWDRNDYKDENGNVYEPMLKEIVYSRYGVFSPLTDFNTFVVIAESEIPETPEEPETQATETDYINALEELGVNFNE